MTARSLDLFSFYGNCKEQNISHIRSPLFYVGDKYKLMPQLNALFPKQINTYIEPFCGGGSSFLNTNARYYKLNDNNKYIIALHKLLKRAKPKEFFDTIFKLIEFYGLTCSFHKLLPPLELREAYKKTYFARFNKKAYIKLRDDFNANQNDFFRLYLLLIYGFNHMIRFNNKGKFNLPVGNVDFNANVYRALRDYFNFTQNRDIRFYNLDFIDFIESLDLGDNDFLYFDPPYLLGTASYNENGGWGQRDELDLYDFIKRLDSKNIPFALSNVLNHKGKTHLLLQDFCNKNDFIIHRLDFSYKNCNYHTKRLESCEVLITNFRGVV